MLFHLSLLARRLHNCYNEGFLLFTAQSIHRIRLVVKYLYYLGHYFYDTKYYFAMVLIQLFIRNKIYFSLEMQLCEHIKADAFFSLDALRAGKVVHACCLSIMRPMEMSRLASAFVGS